MKSTDSDSTGHFLLFLTFCFGSALCYNAIILLFCAPGWMEVEVESKHKNIVLVLLNLLIGGIL